MKSHYETIITNMHNRIKYFKEKCNRLIKKQTELYLIISPNSQHSSSTKFKRPQAKADQVLEKIAKRMEHYFPVRAPEKLEHDMFGAYIEKKLGSIPMVPFVQKIINDAIFFRWDAIT